MLTNLMKYLKEYGDTVIVHDGMFSFGVVTIDYEFNELILNSSVHIDKAFQYQYLRPWLGNGLLTSTGKR